jgi:hypothetical protein
MTTLDNSQIDFLTRHQISLGSVFDATGLGKKEYRPIMKSLGAAVATGVTPCAAKKHTLRTRSGHCIQCNPASIKFQERQAKRAYVYVSGSKNLRLLKVGYSADVPSRIDTLNQLGYAGTNDWEALYWVNLDEAGRIELEAHSGLAKYASPTQYKRDGNTVDCLETFSCGASEAINIVKGLSSGTVEDWTNASVLSQYEFESVIGGEFVRKGSGSVGATPLYRSEREQNVSTDPKMHKGPEENYSEKAEPINSKLVERFPSRTEFEYTLSRLQASKSDSFTEEVTTRSQHTSIDKEAPKSKIKSPGFWGYFYG